MAFTASTMMPLGNIAPAFELLEPATGKMIHSAALLNATVNVVVFWCNHCPYVVYIEAAVLQLVAEFAPLGVQFVFIGSNDANKYPDDGPTQIAERAKEKYGTLPYLYDATQSVAVAYDAACTPDFFVFDKKLQLAYRGRFDAARPKNDTPITGIDLKNALLALLDNRSPTVFQYPSGGCNIKWKPQF